MKESIVLSAWEMVTRFHSLKKLNFIPSMVGTLWLFLIVIYQITFTYVSVFHKKDEFFSVLYQFLHTEYVFEVAGSLALIFILYIFLEPIATGGLIEMIDSYKKTNGEKYHRSFQWFFDGLRHFLPIFEVQNLTSIFRPLSVITFYILLLRIFWVTYFQAITIVMGIYLFFAFFINMCFSYSKFFIIFEGKSAIESLSASTSMTVRHIGITGKLYFTMILLYLRTLIVALIFLVLPFALSSIVTFFTIVEVQVILVVIFSIISIVLFIFIAHLNSTLEIFIEATWYGAYRMCEEEDHTLHGGHSPWHHDDHHGNEEDQNDHHEAHHH